MTAGRSAAAEAARLRAGARRGLWRRIAAWLGVTVHTRRADAVAGRWDRGAAGEEATAGLLAQLEAAGWHVRHDLALPRSRANLDHVLIAPCGTGVVVLDSKVWHRGRDTTLVRGRVHCGTQDRHQQVEKVATYARRVADAVNIPQPAVRPLLIVHGSPIPGGYLEAATPDGPVYVLSPAYLIPTLSSGVREPDVWRSGGLADRVFSVLTPYQQTG